MVLKEGQSSLVQEEAFLSVPVGPPPLSPPLRDEPTWRNGDTPPHRADNLDHVQLDSEQVGPPPLGTGQMEGSFLQQLLVEKNWGILSI